MIKNRLVAAGAAAALATGTALMAVPAHAATPAPVSYTHLTLPTNREV